MIRVEKSGARGWPDWSPRPASLDDITQFIEGRTDDTLLADLLWGSEPQSIGKRSSAMRNIFAARQNRGSPSSRQDLDASRR